MLLIHHECMQKCTKIELSTRNVHSNFLKGFVFLSFDHPLKNNRITYLISRLEYYLPLEAWKKQSNFTIFGHLVDFHSKTIHNFNRVFRLVVRSSFVICLCRQQLWLAEINHVIFFRQSQLLFSEINKGRTTSQKAPFYI